VGANTTIKTLITLAAVGTTAYSGYLGSKIANHGRHAADGATEPSSATPDEAAAAQNQLRIVQWVTPVLTGTVVVLGSQQGEQQRASQVVAGLGRSLSHALAK